MNSPRGAQLVPAAEFSFEASTPTGIAPVNPVPPATPNKGTTVGYLIIFGALTLLLGVPLLVAYLDK